MQPQDVNLESGSIANLSVQFMTLSSAGVIDKLNDSLSRNLHHASNEKTSPVAKISFAESLCINKIKSPEDAKPYLEKPFGCGICEEIVESHKEFAEHCSSHRFSPPDDLCIDLC